jgi:hypothetical protein
MILILQLGGVSLVCTLGLVVLFHSVWVLAWLFHLICSLDSSFGLLLGCSSVVVLLLVLIGGWLVLLFYLSVSACLVVGVTVRLFRLFGCWCCSVVVQLLVLFSCWCCFIGFVGDMIWFC